MNHGGKERKLFYLQRKNDRLKLEELRNWFSSSSIK